MESKNVTEAKNGQEIQTSSKTAEFVDSLNVGPSPICFLCSLGLGVPENVVYTLSPYFFNF